MKKSICISLLAAVPLSVAPGCWWDRGAEVHFEAADWDSVKRTFAVHALARRNLNAQQEKRIRDLRDDRDHRPWVRMAALDALMEIEREKDAQARDKEEAEEKAKEGNTPPTEEK